MGPLCRDADTSLVSSSFPVGDCAYAEKTDSTYLGATTVNERLYGLAVNIELVGTNPCAEFNIHVIEKAKVEACDNCQRYFKAVDMTIDGLAVPLVDEAALAVLDVWASGLGYTKIIRNMIGF